MGAIGPMQLLLLALVVLLVFGGRGRISAILGDAGKGLRVFRKEIDADASRDDEK